MLWETRFNQPLKRVEKKRDEMRADELQVHTLRWLQFLLEYRFGFIKCNDWRYDKTPIMFTPVVLSASIEELFTFLPRRDSNGKDAAKV